MTMKTSIIYEIDAGKYNSKLADALKKIPELKQPEWSLFVKSGVSRKRPSQDPDFWYKRAASILRQIYVKKVVGVNRLRVRYGSLKNRGVKPERFRKGSGKIIRTILQQIEKAGLIRKTNPQFDKRAGRKLTEIGIKLMEEVGGEKNGQIL